MTEKGKMKHVKHIDVLSVGEALIDLISDDSTRPSAVPLQVKIHSETGLEVFREKYFGFPGLVHVVVWQALSQPRYFFFDQNEAVGLIPVSSRQTSSWTRADGHWTWIHTRVPQDVQRRMAGFENRWGWLRARLSHADSAASQA